MRLSSLLFPFQILLAFGNYLNSSKRGGVYGFKLHSLDIVSLRQQVDIVSRLSWYLGDCFPVFRMQVSEFRSPSDRSMTLLHYIADVVRIHYPNVMDIVTEIAYLEKASTGELTRSCDHVIPIGCWRCGYELILGAVEKMFHGVSFFLMSLFV